jgi:hypothetical protein
MKRKVLLTINCGDKTCDDCDWRCGVFCHLFEKTKGPTARLRRCAACRAAEAKAKGGK